MTHDRSVPEIDVPIPGLDEARIEYIVDLAFDDRSERLLEHAQHDMTRFDIDTETMLEVDSQFIQHSHTYELDGTEQPTTKLKIDGYYYKGQSGTKYHVRFIPDIYYDSATILSKNDGDDFKLTKGESSRQVSPIDAAGMVLRATGTDSSNLDGLVEKKIISETLCRELIDRSLVILAETRGSWSRERTVEIQSSDSTIEKPVRIRFGHISSNNLEGSTLKVVIEKVILHIDLNAEEVYRLTLDFSSNPQMVTTSETQPDLEIDATKIVRGDGFTLESADFMHKNAGGTPKPLDPYDPDTAQIFVHTYEELIDSFPASQ